MRNNLYDSYVDGTDYDYLNWKTIPNTDGWYEINTQGEVRCWKNGKGDHKRLKTPHILKPYKCKHGGCIVSIFFRDENNVRKQKSMRVNKLMAEAFMGGVPDGMFVFHKNGDTMDNSLHNLQILPRKTVYSKCRGHSRKPVLKVDKNGEILDVYSSIEEAARKNYMCAHQVTQHCNKKVKYPFRFQDYTFVYDR